MLTWRSSRDNRDSLYKANKNPKKTINPSLYVPNSSICEFCTRHAVISDKWLVPDKTSSQQRLDIIIKRKLYKFWLKFGLSHLCLAQLFKVQNFCYFFSECKYAYTYQVSKQQLYIF